MQKKSRYFYNNNCTRQDLYRAANTQTRQTKEIDYDINSLAVIKITEKTGGDISHRWRGSVERHVWQTSHPRDWQPRLFI